VDWHCQLFHWSIECSIWRFQDLDEAWHFLNFPMLSICNNYGTETIDTSPSWICWCLSEYCVFALIVGRYLIYGIWVLLRRGCIFCKNWKKAGNKSWCACMSERSTDITYRSLCCIYFHILKYLWGKLWVKKSVETLQKVIGRYLCVKGSVTCVSQILNKFHSEGLHLAIISDHDSFRYGLDNELWSV
jgi:hypothetical protein